MTNLEALIHTTKRCIAKRILDEMAEDTKNELTKEECRTELMEKLREEADSDLMDNQ